MTALLRDFAAMEGILSRDVRKDAARRRKIWVIRWREDVLPDGALPPLRLETEHSCYIREAPVYRPEFGATDDGARS